MGFGKNDSSLRGVQEPLSSHRAGLGYRRKYNLETPWNIVRDPEINQPIAEMIFNSYECRQVLSTLARDVFANREGDDSGCKIGDVLDDDETPVHPDTKAIGNDFLNRYAGKKRLIGGRRAKRIVRDGLGTGDCYLEFAIDREGIGRKDFTISDTVYLPPFEMFTCEDSHGHVVAYEQRDRLQTHNPIRWEGADLLRIVQFSFDEQDYYGQSIFHQASTEGAWHNLKDLNEDIMEALRSVGVIPNLHVMPEDATAADIEAYKQNYAQLRQSGVVTDLFLSSGADVRKMEGVNSDLDGLIKKQMDLRMRLLPAGFPAYYIPSLAAGLENVREISKEPARAYSRLRHDACSMVADGLRWMIDCEIVLRKGFDFFEKEGRYKIVFPSFKEASDVLPSYAELENGNEDGTIEDLDE